MGTWAAYTGFTQIAEAIPGAPEPSRPRRTMEQAAKTTNLDTKGMVPVIDFAKPWTKNPPFERLFNRDGRVQHDQDGKVVPLTTEFEDVGELALGKKPSQ